MRRLACCCAGRKLLLFPTRRCGVVVVEVGMHGWEGFVRVHSGLGEHCGGGGANDSLMANGRTFSRDGGRKKRRKKNSKIKSAASKGCRRRSTCSLLTQWGLARPQHTSARVWRTRTDTHIHTHTHTPAAYTTAVLRFSFFGSPWADWVNRGLRVCMRMCVFVCL